MNELRGPKNKFTKRYIKKLAYTCPVKGPDIFVLPKAGFCNGSADTPFTPVSAPQGPQDAPGSHILVPGVGGVGATLKWTNNSASGHYNESNDAPYAPLSAPQGPQDAPGVHLLVPGAGAVGHITSGYG